MIDSLDYAGVSRRARGTPTMVVIDTWEAVPRGKGFVVTIHAGPRPHVARLSAEELEIVRPILDETVEAGGRNEFSRVQFADALRVAIGRDPFRQVGRGGAAWRTARLDIAGVVIGLIFANSDDVRWRQLTGYAVAAFCFAHLCWLTIRVLLRRQP
ncbi:hypothetical protein Ahu01nite_068500 [Winogradskya humida]|uniref:Uncharacterized protein n=2 Tax=Winogradskya humida TaxID=113566 RepID=A0ABQ3ZYW6_9ACTN|nr:hypothetical protein Ahu01nite_068500 [Actinoplanes humidus]